MLSSVSTGSSCFLSFPYTKYNINKIKNKILILRSCGYRIPISTGNPRPIPRPSPSRISMLLEEISESMAAGDGDGVGVGEGEGKGGGEGDGEGSGGSVGASVTLVRSGAVICY